VRHRPAIGDTPSSAWIRALGFLAGGFAAFPYSRVGFSLRLSSPRRIVDWMDAIRVLLVDDSMAFLKAATTFLNGLAGVDVVGSAPSAAEGLAQVAALQPDLVLADVVMPGMSGLQLVRQLKKVTNAPKAIIVTLHDSEAYRSGAMAAGADGFIAKAYFVAEIPPLLESLFPGRRP